MSNSELSKTYPDKAQVSVASSILQDFLPPTYKLEMNEEIRALSFLSTQGTHILAQQQFTKNEWSVLLVYTGPIHSDNEKDLCKIQ